MKSDMKWKKFKKVSEFKRELKLCRDRMESALLLSASRGDKSYSKNSMTSKWRVLNNHATSMGGISFMGKNVFIEWIKNERKIPLQSSWKTVIDSFCKKYGCNGDNSGDLG